MNGTIDEISKLLDLGKVTSLELVTSALKEIDSEEGQGQTTFTKTYADQAKAQAIAIDKLRVAGLVLSPIAGMPISIKDLFDVAGETTMAGSRVRENSAPALTPQAARLPIDSPVDWPREQLVDLQREQLFQLRASKAWSRRSCSR